MSSSGLITINFQIMTNDNKQQKLSDSTDTAIAYSTCCVSGAVSKDGISLIHGDSLQAQLSAAFAICCRNIVCLYLGLNSLKNLW